MSSFDCEGCSGFSTSHFCTLKNKHLTLLNDQKNHIEFKKGDVIFREGDIPQGLYCISQGVVRLNHMDADGNEVLLRLNKSGDILGYRALFAEEPYHATAIAHEKAEVCFIPLQTIKNIVDSDSDLAMSFLKQVSKELHSVEDRMSAVISKPVQSRVAEALLYFKAELPETKWTRRDIAEWIGATPETVMRTLAQLETDGFIEQEGRFIRITDYDALMKVAYIS